MRARVVRCLLLAAACAGCRVNPVAQLAPTLARYNAFVRTEAGDSIAALYTADGELVTGRGVIRGPDAIRSFLNSFTAVRLDSSAMWTDSAMTTDSGVVQWGRFYQVAVVSGRAMPPASGHFIALWRRQADGRWLLRRMAARGER